MAASLGINACVWGCVVPVRGRSAVARLAEGEWEVSLACASGLVVVSLYTPLHGDSHLTSWLVIEAERSLHRLSGDSPSNPRLRQSIKVTREEDPRYCTQEVESGFRFILLYMKELSLNLSEGLGVDWMRVLGCDASGNVLLQFLFPHASLRVNNVQGSSTRNHQNDTATAEHGLEEENHSTIAVPHYTVG